MNCLCEVAVHSSLRKLSSSSLWIVSFCLQEGFFLREPFLVFSDSEVRGSVWGVRQLWTCLCLEWCLLSCLLCVSAFFLCHWSKASLSPAQTRALSRFRPKVCCCAGPSSSKCVYGVFDAKCSSTQAILEKIRCRISGIRDSALFLSANGRG